MVKNTDEAPPPDITPSILSKDTSVPISSLPVQLSVEDYTSKYPENHLSAIVNNWRLSCYLAIAQIFLQKNALLDRKLEADDIKPRLVFDFFGVLSRRNVVLTRNGVGIRTVSSDTGARREDSRSLTFTDKL